MIEVRTAGKEEFPKNLRLLIAGASGVGKTTLAMQFPNALWAEAKSGLTTLSRGDAIRYVKIGGEEDMLNLKYALKNQMIPEVDTLVVDTLDEFQRILLAERLRDKGRTETTLDDYGWLNLAMDHILTGLNQLDLNIIYITHLQDIFLNNDKVMNKPALQGQFKDRIHEFVDVSLLMQASTTVEKVVMPTVEGTDEGGQLVVVSAEESFEIMKRWLISTPTDIAEWPHDLFGKLPSKLPVDEDTYATLIDLLIPNEDLVDSVTEVFEEPEPEPDEDEIVIENGDEKHCDTCGATIDPSTPWADLAVLRFGVPLCGLHYKEKA